LLHLRACSRALPGAVIVHLAQVARGLAPVALHDPPHLGDPGHAGGRRQQGACDGVEKSATASDRRS
jgi:hypothetical protein